MPQIGVVSTRPLYRLAAIAVHLVVPQFAEYERCRVDFCRLEGGYRTRGPERDGTVFA